MSFKESLVQGNLGELIVKDFIEHQSWVRKVVDLRLDTKSQEDDVDFLVENLKRQFIKMEVKTDFVGDVSGNIAYELSTSSNIGCFEKTKADWIAYYFPNNTELLLLDVKKLRQFVKDRQYSVTDMGDAAKGFLIPISDLRQEGNIIIHKYEGVE